METRERILLLAKAIEAVFSSSEWTEVGYLTRTDEYISGHPRLLRSLRWGDDDYKGHVLDAVAHILKDDDVNFRKLVDYEPISTWLSANDPGGLHALQAEAHGMTVPDVLPTASQTALAALADAQALLESRGPTSAIDRVHTGLHGFLNSACAEAGIPTPPDATPNQLLKLILDKHPALQGLGPREQEVRKLIRTSASILDALATLRNRASLAHPNEELLGHEEALLALNLGRSLLRFLDAKLRGVS